MAAFIVAKFQRQPYKLNFALKIFNLGPSVLNASQVICFSSSLAGKEKF